MRAHPLDAAHELALVAQELASTPEEQPTLERIVERAVATVDPCDFCGVSLRRSGRLETPAWTSPLVLETDRWQHELGEGPALDSIYVDDVYRVDDLRTDTNWPRWAPKAASLGIASMVSVRLATTSEILGGLNLYSGRPNAFNEYDVDLAHVYARLAAGALAAARQVTTLQTALLTRHTIGMAQGMLMQRFGLSQNQAFEVLRRHSQQTNTKLRDVARGLVESGSLPEGHPAHPAGPWPPGSSPTTWTLLCPPEGPTNGQRV